MPFVPSVKDEDKTVKRPNPAMDSAIKRRMKKLNQNLEEDVIAKTKKVGY